MSAQILSSKIHIFPNLITLNRKENSPCMSLRTADILGDLIYCLIKNSNIVDTL
jgi:hypothetical protein